MVTDRVANFIISLKNAAAISKADVSVPHATHLEAIAKKLKELGYLTGISVTGDIKKVLTVTLAFDSKGNSMLHDVKRVSKPGRRLYSPARDVHSVKHGNGARILSTPKGILTDAEARKVHVGGENLFEIW